jgi:hypothetical protein
MGSPIHHGAFRPRRALEPRGACQNAHTFNVLSDKRSHRFEEVNNYSDLMTRRFYGPTLGRAFQSINRVSTTMISRQGA